MSGILPSHGGPRAYASLMTTADVLGRKPCFPVGEQSCVGACDMDMDMDVDVDRILCSLFSVLYLLAPPTSRSGQQAGDS
ncbi:hypothetical protein FRC20_006872 [Serendipita sp. 405]|nr:hypothetical protein FRC20_006872 [Serendipita sp. 405]